MDITKLSDNGLKSLHEGVRKAAASDAVNPNKRDPYYGVNEFSDWATWRDALESELGARLIDYDPVSF